MSPLRKAERYMDEFQALLKKNVIGDEDFALMNNIREKLAKIFPTLGIDFQDDAWYRNKVLKLDDELKDLVYEMNFLQNL
ncbi:hypothetical protein HDU87_002488 [Geranomyces variabilis]|uniref:Uncharacterized protein n=1 Tax=Geranomyces variabilis TaxID=109894 RepID=A0AAD5TB28_9FUNG|nr:hypothetical protein HDU87_002488 [Geranomyces variabilis]